ncbi:MAG: hypothetical protein HOE69_02850 [Euryarchaeota archaeon]|nr:hypothetical protein [Euryarchaeota archaeon]
MEIGEDNSSHNTEIESKHDASQSIDLMGSNLVLPIAKTVSQSVCFDDCLNPVIPEIDAQQAGAVLERENSGFSVTLIKKGEMKK